METKEKLPQISLFHHKHGVSVSIIPPGKNHEEFWTDMDGYEDREDEYIESYPVPMPYAIAPELLATLKEVSQAGHEGHLRGIIGKMLLSSIDKAISKAEGR